MVEWLAAGESRIGLGCMRLSTEPRRDEARAIATVHSALEAGVSVFDTAHAYGLDEDDRGHNERLLARALAAHPRGAGARVVTKGGMTRPGGAWRPDGRAGAILADCEASLRALGGRAIDLYLLHAPDPRVQLATSVRALASLVERGLVARVGVSNLTRGQLAEALELAPLAAIEVSLAEALRGGVVSLAVERGLWVLAHAPLGGPRGAAALSRDRDLAAVAARLGVSAAQLVLSGVLALHPRIIALPGARRPESAREAAAASRLVLDEDARAKLAKRVGRLERPRPAAARAGCEVVLIAGLSGAGKSTEVERFVAQGYARLNRDERGGTLARIVAALDQRLAGGAERVVLDNTYLTRASRHDVLEVAARHSVAARCLWLETPFAEAQRNVVERMLEAHGRLLAPDELGGDDPTRLAPRALFSQARRVEPPEADEGFASIEVVSFSRRGVRRENAGRAIAIEALRARGARLLEDGEPGPRLVFAWLPDGDEALAAASRELAELRERAASRELAGLDVELATCTHPGGRPICWCRPPLPGLLLAFAHRARVDPARLIVVGTTPAHRKLAEAAGARFELVELV